MAMKKFGGFLFMYLNILECKVDVLMAVNEISLPRKSANKKHNSRGGARSMDKKPTVEEMEKALGLDKIKAIQVISADVAEDMKEKGDPFRHWYEEELTRLYNDERNQ